MSLQVALRHETRYAYDRRVTLGPQVVRLRPAPHCRTPILAYSLHIRPEGHFLNWQQDPQGNYLARAVFERPTQEFSVVVDLVAELTPINPFEFFLEESAEHWPFSYDEELRDELEPFLDVEAAGPKLAAWLAGVSRSRCLTSDFLVALNQRLAKDIEYVIRLEPGVQTSEETLEKGRGSCRDSAWLLVQILRQLGLGARFVSGYLIQLVPDVVPSTGPRGPAQDFTDLHAWAEVYLPGAGWVGLDPTSGLLAGEGHIPLACGPRPGSAAPISGVVDPCEVEFSHEMSVTRVLETPRSTRPYTEPTWRAIEALGEEVDRRLEAGDVRLTLGGEPTFVATQDREAPEWNSDALGPTKYQRAVELIGRLRERFAPGGLLHFGEGKWYPGEPLPRWALTLLWREDGAPLSRETRRLAGGAESRAPDVADATRFVQVFARRLTLDPEAALPAYEDPLRALLEEGALPENLRHDDPALADEAGRSRLLGALSRGLGRPVACVLPVQVWNARDGRRFRTERWRFRRGALLLTPGDSPAGLRLPLASLPWLAPEDYPEVVEQDPTVPRAPLPPPRLSAPEGQALPPTEVDAASGGFAVRTALVVEPRDGLLRVFLPPFETADDFVELTAALEDTARELDLSIRLEGYLPPSDPRIGMLQVTPDPGVIEVNVQPARSWAEVVRNTTAVYEEAEACGLAAEKFLVDGRHTGTGGGNHVVVGGPTPLDSPLLRRPDLLRSLIAYWINHPSLSYLFSGLFIGPTSQAPRADEARHDALRELELAFAKLPERGAECPPWLVDRLFRNLLVDVTGNTHRAEFCIDKLYSPDTAGGRRGLLELRAFEMPPHARMSAAQQLLLRALIARFWETPYRAALARWGTALQDRFTLPHFVWEDFRGVLEELRDAGFGFQDGWFEPHREFRFPVVGRIARGSLELELRQGLEPWHVLGEEGIVGGTARYVDSSLERLEVKVRGAAGDRYAIGCNGLRVPLAATGESGERVAGVRFRAWQPPRALHPTIGVHAPLRFDVVDTWNGRAVGGCAYHVSHPGGRSHEDFPVNAESAAGRRAARFLPFGHTPGALELREPPPNPEFPHTLDLRWAST